jgi:hypothetical protein
MAADETVNLYAFIKQDVYLAKRTLCILTGSGIFPACPMGGFAMPGMDK